MGEIGISRKEFLNELKFWEIRSIIRGYNARHHAGWEQARLVAYHVRFCMGVKSGESVPSIEQWRPFSWEKPEPISQEEIDEVQNDLDEIMKHQKQ